MGEPPLAPADGKADGDVPNDGDAELAAACSARALAACSARARRWKQPAVTLADAPSPNPGEFVIVGHDAGLGDSAPCSTRRVGARGTQMASCTATALVKSGAEALLP